MIIQYPFDRIPVIGEVLFCWSLGMIWLLLSPVISARPVDTPAFLFYTPDSILVDVYPERNAEDHLVGYVARVNSSICEKTECYDVALDFYWDVLGNFDHYEIVPENPLTKRKHEPFTADDYAKLMEVLKLENPSFVGMQKEALIGELVSDGLDGFTGATIAAIKDEIVPGAAYSCYTLWHIAHGRVIDSIRAFSSNHLDGGMIRRLASSEDEAAHYFLVDHLPDSLYKDHGEIILDLMKRNGGYFTRYAIDEIPKSVLKEVVFQEFFTVYFSTFDYFAQMNLVKRLQKGIIGDGLGRAMVNQLEMRGSALREGIIKLLLANQDYLHVRTKQALLDKLISVNPPLSASQLHDIQLWRNERTLRRQVKILRRLQRRSHHPS